MNDTTDRKNGDGRAAAIGNIWWASLAMLGVCIPLCAILKSASLPFIIIGVAAAVTLHIWHHGAEPRAMKRERSEAEILREQIAELEERLANVEAINAYGEKLAQRERADAEADRRRDAAATAGEAEVASA